MQKEMMMRMLDNLKAENYERSLFMIKPDSHKYKEEILDDLRANNFKLECVNDVILTKRFIEKLYGLEEDKFIQYINIKYLLGKTATIGIALGEDCKKRLFEVCGDTYDPDRCSKDSIRYKYSTVRKPILIYGHKFYINAIHRSSPQDAENEIRLYMNEYIEKSRGMEFANTR